MTLRRKVIPVEFQIKPFVRQMKSPRPPRMAGRRAAILLIRLVAPCARSAALSLLARHPLRVFGRSTLLSTLCFLFLRLRHSEPHLSCLRGAFARPAPVPFSAACHAPLIFLLLRRFAAPPVFSCPAPSPRGGRSAERRTQKPVAPAKRNHRVSETRCRPGHRDGACRRSTVAVYGPRDHASRVRKCLGPCRAFPRPAARPAVRVPRPPGRGCTAVSGRHTPLRLRTSPETPLTSEDGGDIASMHEVVNSVFRRSHEVVM